MKRWGQTFWALVALLVFVEASTLIPSYYIIRGYEQNEARNYLLDQTEQVKNKISEKVSILQKAGVSNIESYVQEAGEDLIRTLEEQDTKGSRFIFDAGRRLLYASDGSDKIAVHIELLNMIDHAGEIETSIHRENGSYWMSAYDKDVHWNWYILTSMTEAEIYSDSINYLRIVLAISFIISALVIAQYLALVNKVENRKAYLVTQFQAFKYGNTGARLNQDWPADFQGIRDEINALLDHVELQIYTRKSIEQELKSKYEVLLERYSGRE